jgi:hypothetical protein
LNRHRQTFRFAAYEGPGSDCADHSTKARKESRDPNVRKVGVLLIDPDQQLATKVRVWVLTPEPKQGFPLCVSEGI